MNFNDEFHFVKSIFSKFYVMFVAEIAQYESQFWNNDLTYIHFTIYDNTSWKCNFLCFMTKFSIDNLFSKKKYDNGNGFAHYIAKAIRQRFTKGWSHLSGTDYD